jgi:DNA-binding MarR family transcriptional regulator
MKIKKFVQLSPVVGIMATQLKLSGYLEKKFQSVALTYLEALVLATLFFEDGGKDAGPSNISRNLLYPLPRVSAAISSLQEKGYVTREFVKTDSRKFKVVLTSKGSKKSLQVIGIFNSVQESIEKSISEAQSVQINKLLLKLRLEVFSE